MEKRIYLWIRRSKKYYNEIIQNPIYRSTNIMSHLTIDEDGIEHFSKAMFIWKLFFGMSYGEFRKRLVNIAALSYAPNNFDGIVEYRDVDKLEGLKDTWILPVDDDDWLAPNCVQTVRSLDTEGKNGITWKAIGITPYNTLGIDPLEWDDRCELRSCEYVIKDLGERKIESHWVMDTYNKTHPEQMLRLDDYLSVKLDNIGSISVVRSRNIDELMSLMRNGILLPKFDCLKDYDHLVDLYNELLTELFASFKL